MAHAIAFATAPAATLLVIREYESDGPVTELLAQTGIQNRIPVIVMSAMGDEKIAVEAIKLGVIDYFIKNVKSLSNLPRIVENSLREWSRKPAVPDAGDDNDSTKARLDGLNRTIAKLKKQQH